MLNASFDDGNSKIADDNNGGLKWSVDDQIDVFQNNAKIGFLKCTDADNGVFSGDIDLTTDDLTFTYGKEIGDGYYMEQSGELGDVIYLTASAPYNAKGDYDVTMTMPHAVLKLDLSGFAGSGNVTISDGTNTASVAGVTAASTAVYVAVPAESPKEATEKTYRFKGNGLIAKKNWPALTANTFYSAMDPESNLTGNAIVIEVVVPKFSVSETTTVEFASGNLWYNTDEEKFYFESNQWSFAKSWDAKHVSHFFWGKTALIACAQTYNDGNASTHDIFFTNQEGFMVNGEMGWRTLSSDEWIYLTGVSGGHGGGHAQNARINAENLYAWKTLDDGAYRGWIILPDGTDYEIAFGDGDWAISSVLDLDFYGAIFLPAAGYRNGTGIDNDDNGYYWSSTPYPISDRGYSFSRKFGGSSVDSRYRNRGSSVRLVR